MARIIGTTGSAPPAPRPRKRQPQPKPQPASFTQPIAAKPFARQQQQAATRTRAAVRRLPTPVVAAPPVIHNPTPRQVHAAARQITQSLTRAVGPGGSNRERIARRDALVAQIRTDPRLVRIRQSLAHWQTEQAKLVNPGAYTDRVKAGPAPTRARVGIGPLEASVNLTALGSGLRRTIAAATPGLQAGDPEAQFARNALGDVKSLAEAPFIGGYEIAATGADLFTGHPGRAANRAYRLGKGVVQSTLQTVEHPEKSFVEHPLLTGLTFTGLGSIAGRTAGAIARGAGSTVEAAGVRGALARAGSTVRPSIALSEDPAGGIAERNFSKDLGRKQIQKARDAGREPLTHPDGTPVLGPRGEPVLKPRSETERARLNKRRGDLLASRANLSERLARDQATRDMAVPGVTRAAARRIGRQPTLSGIRGRAARDAVAMVTEGTIRSARTFEADLRKHVDRLKGLVAQHDQQMRTSGQSSIFRHQGELDAAKARIKTGEAILGSPRALAQKAKIVDAGVEHGRALVARDVEGAKAGLIDAEQARRARLVVTATEHMGARHGFDHRLKAQAAKALKVERSLRARLNLHTPSEKLVGAAKEGHDKAAARLDAIDRRLSRLEQDYHNAVGLGDHHAAEAVMGDIEALNSDRAEAFGHHQRLARQLRTLREPGERLRAQIETAQEIRAKAEARNTERLRNANGDPLEPGAIEAHLHAAGRDPGTVAYLPPHVSSRQFHRQFRPSAGRGSLDANKGPRTGELHRKGGTEASAQLLRAAGVRSATATTKATQIDRLISAHGMRHPAFAKAEHGQPLTKHEQNVVNRGGYYTGREAAEVINRAEAHGEDLVPVRAYPARLDPETQRAIRDELQNPGGMELLGQRLLNSRFLTEDELKAGGARNVVLMNKTLVDRLNAHLQPAGSTRKFLQIVNRGFRYAVLPQPRWIAGNFIEPLLVRMPGVGSGINVFGLAADLRAAEKTIRAAERSTDPAVRAAAQEIRAHQFGGLLIGGRGQTIHRGLSDFPALSKDAEKAYGKIVSRVPAVKQMAQFSGLMLRGGGKAILAPLDAIFHLNRAGEQILQKAAFGHSVRAEVAQFTGSWTQTVKLGQRAADEAAKGLVNTATQERFMRAQHDLLGKYEGFNPTLRGLIQTVAPFLPWALNAAKFVFWTMPVHRTAQTALLIQVNNVVSKDWQEIHKNTPPGSLRLAIPNGKGGWIDLARYTTYGLTAPVAEGDYQGITGQFVPQLQGIQNALQGKDPFGSDLRLSTGAKPTGADKAKIALNQALEAMVPYLSNFRRLQEHGETAYSDSTALHPRTKPGTGHGMSALERTLSPIRPTYLSAGATTSSGPVSPQQALLERAAERAGGGALSPEQIDLLTRAAQRAGG